MTQIELEARWNQAIARLSAIGSVNPQVVASIRKSMIALVSEVQRLKIENQRLKAKVDRLQIQLGRQQGAIDAANQARYNNSFALGEK